VSVTVPGRRTRQGASCDPGPKHSSKRQGFCQARRDASSQVKPLEPVDRVGGSRFTQPDPVSGGCANNYTYAYGDPLNNPDLSGEFSFGHLFHSIGCFVSRHKVAIGIALGVASVFTGGASLLAEGALAEGLGTAGALTGALASLSDTKDCLEEGGGACVGAGLGLGGALLSGAGLAFPGEIDESTGAGALAAKLGAAVGFGAGLGGLTYDTATAFAAPQKKSHC
jgi:hypothetical protein